MNFKIIRSCSPWIFMEVTLGPHLYFIKLKINLSLLFNKGQIGFVLTNIQDVSENMSHRSFGDSSCKNKHIGPILVRLITPGYSKKNNIFFQFIPNFLKASVTISVKFVLKMSPKNVITSGFLVLAQRRS